MFTTNEFAKRKLREGISRPFRPFNITVEGDCLYMAMWARRCNLNYAIIVCVFDISNLNNIEIAGNGTQPFPALCVPIIALSAKGKPEYAACAKT